MLLSQKRILNSKTVKTFGVGSTANQKFIHLKGLNGIRAIAAIAVVFSHIHLWFKFKGDTQLAGFGVTIFFTLSGFLITYLLLQEEKVQEINVRRFYIRRILRIWPLYYLVLFIVVCILFSQNETIGYPIYFYIFLLANIPSALNFAIPLLSHYWSLGIEEQFYLVWPHLIKRINNKKITICIFIVIVNTIRVCFNLFGKTSIWYNLIYSMRFDCMAIGALGAVIVFNNNTRILKLLFLRSLQSISWLVMLLLAINKFHIISLFDHQVVSLSALVLIINVSFNKLTCIVSLDNFLFEFLGKISYGIYVIHPLVIFGILKFWSPTFSVGHYIVVVLLVLLTTIGFAYFSYTNFEKFFINRKDRFAAIKTSIEPVQVPVATS